MGTGRQRAACLRKTTWYRGSLQGPILWRASQRGAVATHAKVSARGNSGLRYVLVPWETKRQRIGPKAKALSAPFGVGNCCDALRCSGPHARYTDKVSEFYSLNSPWPEGLGNLVKLYRAGDRALQLLLFNEECLVSASHQLALITSLPFGCLYEGLSENHFSS